MTIAQYPGFKKSGKTNRERGKGYGRISREEGLGDKNRGIWSREQIKRMIFKLHLDQFDLGHCLDELPSKFNVIIALNK